MIRALPRLLVLAAAGVATTVLLRRAVAQRGGVAGVRTGSQDTWPPVPPAPGRDGDG